jgi:hypothetical protein
MRQRNLQNNIIKIMSKPPIKKKYIETPEKMWELFIDYQSHTKKTPLKVQDYVGKDGNMVYRDKERPLTMEGFRNYCRRTIACVNDYFANTNKAYDSYSNICRAIMDEIRQDQIEGGMAGIYNPSITQRLNGLTDKSEVMVKEQPLFEDKIEETQ